jgi:hypothetical protein
VERLVETEVSLKIGNMKKKKTVDIYHATVIFANGYIMGRHSCVFFFKLFFLLYFYIFKLF